MKTNPIYYKRSRRLFVATGLVLAIGTFVSLKTSQAQNQNLNPHIIRVKPPELVGEETDWLNTPDKKPLKLADRKGKVTKIGRAHV